MKCTEEMTLQSAVVKRSIVIAGHRTSVSLENDFWSGLKEIGREHKMTLSSLITDINDRRPDTNLSSAVRLFVLRHFRSKISQTFPGRVEAGMELPRIAQVGQQSQ
jgi:predicted DNA-binding ribbon-helix-helix protein